MSSLLRVLWVAGILVLAWGWHRAGERQRLMARQAVLLSRLPAALLNSEDGPAREVLGEVQHLALAVGGRPTDLARLQQASLRVRALCENGQRESAQKMLANEVLPITAALSVQLLAAAHSHWPVLTVAWALLGAGMLRPRPAAPEDPTVYSQRLLRVIDSLLIVIDPRGAILAVNAATCRVLGYSESELLGRPYQEIYSQRDDLLTMASRRDLEGQYRRRDGCLVPVIIACSLLNQGGQTLALVTLAQDISEKQATEARLESSESRLRLLLDRYLATQEEERRALARDLHDGLLQYLVAAQLQLHAASPVPEPVKKACQHLLAAVDEGRRLIQNLRPSALEQFGLAETLRRQLEQARDELGWQVRLEEKLGALSPAVETTLYRLAQEALSNARKHARAGSVSLSLQQMEREVVFEFRDNGVGFEPKSGAGLGLESMRERAELLGGWLRVESTPGAGTTIRAALPFSPADPSAPLAELLESGQKPAAC